MVRRWVSWGLLLLLLGIGLLGCKKKPQEQVPTSGPEGTTPKQELQKQPAGTM